MKVIPEDYFEEAKFIVSQTKYDYSQKKGTGYHVAYNVNDPFVKIMGASAISLLENNPKANFTFHIFTDGCSDENKKRIQEMAQQNQCCCYLYELNMKPFEDFHIKVARFSRITYARIYMPKILYKMTNRFLYVDADAMCVAPIDELMHVDLQGAAIGAVSEFPESVAYRAGFLKLKSGKYFNDGIMLVDIDEWEKQKISERAFSYQNEPKENFLGQSQDVLNKVFDGAIYFLPLNYNQYGGGARDDGHSVFIHWTGRKKPWQMVLTKFDKQWREYNKLSPWDTITNIRPVKKPENYHDFQQWGRYQKQQGNYGEYLWGIFWYAFLKMQLKLKG